MDFTTLTDGELWLISSSMEQAEWHRRSALYKTTRKLAEKLEKDIDNEYRKRNIHWASFERE
jgi:hypothetical protein